MKKVGIKVIFVLEVTVHRHIFELGKKISSLGVLSSLDLTYRVWVTKLSELEYSIELEYSVELGFCFLPSLELSWRVSLSYLIVYRVRFCVATF